MLSMTDVHRLGDCVPVSCGSICRERKIDGLYERWKYAMKHKMWDYDTHRFADTLEYNIFHYMLIGILVVSHVVFIGEILYVLFS